MKRQNYILIELDDQHNLISTLQEIKDINIQIIDVFTPHPIMGIEEYMPQKKSFIGMAGLLAGLITLMLVLYFQVWVSREAYPLVYGAKPYEAWLSYVPVLFESIVLFAVVAIVLVFLIETRMSSQKKSLLQKIGASSNKFAIMIQDDENISGKDISYLFEKYKIIKL
jgi:hypothetical protein